MRKISSLPDILQEMKANRVDALVILGHPTAVAAKSTGIASVIAYGGRPGREVRAEIASSRAFALEVVGEALGQFRNELVDEISEMYRSAFAKVEASLETLRADPRRSREDDDTRAIDLPLLRSSRLQ